jgi:surface antigen
MWHRAGNTRERQVARDLCLNTGGVRNAVLGAFVAWTLGWGPAAAEEAADDLQHLRPLINQTLETEKIGVEIGWSNPTTGHSGTLTVERTFYRDQQPCREYVRTVERPYASILVTRGIGCRVGRAQWEIEEESATATPSTGPGAGSADAAAKRREASQTAAKDAAAASECPDPAEVATAGTDQPKPAPFAAFTVPARSDI